MEKYQYLTIEKTAHVAVVTFNRPQASNALNYPFLCEIEHCALSFRDDSDTRVVIFTGAGRHYTAGADLKEFDQADEPPMLVKRRRLRIGERILKAILGMEQITISAWKGGAIGGGGCIATATDFRIGTEDCFLYYPEIELGLNLMWQSLPRLVRLVGESNAIRLAIGAEKVGANTLLAWGLLEELVPSDKLLERAREFAQTYVNKPPIAAQMIKRSISAIGSQLDGAMMHMDADQHFLASRSRDHGVAVDAYMNKRSADFSGE